MRNATSGGSLEPDVDLHRGPVGTGPGSSPASSGRRHPNPSSGRRPEHDERERRRDSQGRELLKRVTVLRVDHPADVRSRVRGAGAEASGFSPKDSSGGRAQVWVRNAGMRRPDYPVAMRFPRPSAVRAPLAPSASSRRSRSRRGLRQHRDAVPAVRPRARQRAPARPDPDPRQPQDPVGRTRFLALAKKNNPIGSPDLPVTVAFYDVAKSTTQPSATADATSSGRSPARRVSTSSTRRSGARRLIASSPRRDGIAEKTRVQFQVSTTSSFAVGLKAPDTPTPTLADVGGDVHKISTDQRRTRFYQVSEHDVLAQQAVQLVRHAGVLPVAPVRSDARRGEGLREDRARDTFINVEPQPVHERRPPTRLRRERQPPADRRDERLGPPLGPWIVVDKNGIVQAVLAHLHDRRAEGGSRRRDEVTAALRDVSAPGPGRGDRVQPPAVVPVLPGAWMGVPSAQQGQVAGPVVRGDVQSQSADSG